MSTRFQWRNLSEAVPEEGRLVEATTPNGSVSLLSRCGGLWFVADGSCYVYWTPVMWRYAD